MSDLILCEVGETGLDDLESYSPFCVKVHRALRVAGLAYTSRHGRHPGEFSSLNPTGQVPVLLVGDEPVSDSTVIVDRIETLAGRPFHGGLDERTVAEARLWEDFADTSLNGFVVASRWADDDNWPRAKAAFFADAPKLICALIAPRLRKKVVADLVARDVWRAGSEACWRRFEDMLDQLDRRAPVDGFWVADRSTAADLALFGQLHSFRCPITPHQAERVAAHERLSRYLDRVQETTRVRRPMTARESPRMRELVALLSS
ncbi:MAG: glutathione S-transferase family protein [Polyangiaceae bacterium]